MENLAGFYLLKFIKEEFDKPIGELHDIFHTESNKSLIRLLAGSFTKKCSRSYFVYYDPDLYDGYINIYYDVDIKVNSILESADVSVRFFTDEEDLDSPQLWYIRSRLTWENFHINEAQLITIQKVDRCTIDLLELHDPCNPWYAMESIHSEELIRIISDVGFITKESAVYYDEVTATDDNYFKAYPIIFFNNLTPFLITHDIVLPF